MRTWSHWILAAAAAAIAMPTLGAFAQDDDGAIDKIVVTARKKEESLQEAPLSISALTADDIEGLGIQETDDIMALAPNLYITQTPGSSANIGVSIRGVGGAEPLLTRDTGVAIYVDDAYIARTAGAVFDLVDLERVEVLRGPQGTLYGRNATGGAVKFISRKPGEEFGFKQTFSLGRFSQLLSRTRVDSGLIGDTGLSSSFSFLYKERDGYVDNRLASDEDDPGAYETKAFRLSLNWAASEDVNVSYAFDYSDLDGAPPAFQLFGINPTLAGALAAGGSSFPAANTDRQENISLDADGRSLHEITGHNLTIEWELGDFLLKSTTTYRDWENEERGTDLDGSANLLIATLNPGTFGFIPAAPTQIFAATGTKEQDQITQEFQFSGNITESIDFVAGFYYFKEEFEEFNPQSFVFPFSPFAPPLNFNGLFNSTLAYDGENSSWAVYANATWVITDSIAASAGLRWSRDDKEFTLFSTAASMITGITTKSDDDWSNLDWSFDLSWAITEDINSYFRVATAFKSGGFNPRSGALSTNGFEEETITNYELGLKSRFLDGRLQVNTAVFFSDYEDLQTDQFAAGTGGATSITVNAGQAEITGFELEIKAQPTENLGFYLNYGYQDMDYDEFETRHPGSGQVLDIANDAIFAYRPEHTLASGIEYLMPVGDGMELSFRVDARYVDDLAWHATPDSIVDSASAVASLTPFNDCGSFTDGTSAACIAEDGYALVDVRLTLSNIQVSERMTAKVALWGHNVLDKAYIESGIDFGALGFGGARFGAPATWGVDVTFEY